MRLHAAEHGARGLVRGDFEIDAGERLERLADLARTRGGERVLRGDLADAVGETLQIERLRLPLGLRGNRKRAELHDRRGDAQLEVALRAGGEDDDLGFVVNSFRGDDEPIGPGRKPAELKRAVGARDGEAVDLRKRDGRTLDKRARRGAAHGAADDGGGVGLRESDERRNDQREQRA